MAEALQRTVIFCRWLRWPRCLGGESRAGMLLLVQVETELQGWWLHSSPPAGVCGWAGAVVEVEVRIPGKKKVTEIL